MKAIIFATSIKEGKNSNTRAWCVELDKEFKNKGFDSEIITLRDYDYESSTETDKDLLHEQMYKLYDTDFIMFTSPCNFSHMTFYFANLLKRFEHAYKKSDEKGLKIFDKKMFEFCPTFGCSTYPHDKKETTDWQKHEDLAYPNGIRSSSYPYDGTRHNKWVYEKLKFMKPLGLIDLHIDSWNPIEPIGPDRRNMHGHPQTVATIGSIVKKIETNGILQSKTTPSCTLEQFIECFRSDDHGHAFGRGLTLAVENLNFESAQKHIEYLNNNKKIPNHVRYQAIVAMKDRSIRAGLYDTAELYYDQQVRHNIDWYTNYATSHLNKNGNMRPNNY